MHPCGFALIEPCPFLIGQVANRFGVNGHSRPRLGRTGSFEVMSLTSRTTAMGRYVELSIATPMHTLELCADYQPVHVGFGGRWPLKSS
jgi:hypothetical protein